MALPGIGGLGGPTPITRPSLLDGAGKAGATGLASPGPRGAAGVDGAAFADQISSALESVSRSQQVADGLAQQAATGTLSDVHDYMIASTQAQLATELTVAVRNRALESFQTVMNLQV